MESQPVDHKNHPVNGDLRRITGRSFKGPIKLLPTDLFAMDISVSSTIPTTRRPNLYDHRGHRWICGPLSGPNDDHVTELNPILRECLKSKDKEQFFSAAKIPRPGWKPWLSTNDLDSRLSKYTNASETTKPKKALWIIIPRVCVIGLRRNMSHKGRRKKAGWSKESWWRECPKIIRRREQIISRTLRIKKTKIAAVTNNCGIKYKYQSRICGSAVLTFF